MAIAMHVNDDPNASAGNAAVMAALGVAFAALALTVYLPVLRCAAPDRLHSGQGQPAAAARELVA
jgi:hypothetical protein